MQSRTLGRSGLKISELTYGNWITHGSQVDDRTARSTIQAALDCGITSFDTADVYADGKAEAILGEALKGQRRDGVEIFTKVYWPTGPGANDRGLSRKHIMESCHASLERLKTDYVDLYQAHRYDHETPLEETLKAFDDLIRQGKVLYVGVSEWTPGQIREAIALAGQMGLARIISNQPQYSMLWRVIEADVVPTSTELGIGQIVWSPVAQGVLTGKYLPGLPAPLGTRATSAEGSGIISRWLRAEVLSAVQRLKPIASDHGLTLAQLSLAWVLAHPHVSAAIIGASRPEQVDENAKASGVVLGPDVMAAIDEVLADVIIRDPGLTASSARRP